MPGLKTAKAYYDRLASGDQKEMTAAVAPAMEAISQQTTAAKQNIQNTAPRGGVKTLALEEADIAAAGQKGDLLTRAYTSAFPAEASLGQGGTGLSINEVANAIAGFQGASSTIGQLGQEQAAGKASQLAFIGGLAGDAATLGAAACWIAEVLWGKTDDRTIVLRYWLNNLYVNTPFGRFVVALYRRFGRGVAAVLARNCWLQWPFRWLFERALVRAHRELDVMMRTVINAWG